MSIMEDKLNTIIIRYIRKVYFDKRITFADKQDKITKIFKFQKTLNGYLVFANSLKSADHGERALSFFDQQIQEFIRDM